MSFKMESSCSEYITACSDGSELESGTEKRVDVFSLVQLCPFAIFGCVVQSTYGSESQ